MADEAGYNGWKNRETWAVNLWISNDYGSSKYWEGVVEELRTEHIPEQEEYSDDEGEPRKPTEEEQDEYDQMVEDGKAEAIDELAKRLESEHEEGMPKCEGIYADMLSSAFGRVDWHEIAKCMFEE